jgi:Xaa-Pro aminopeptidase
MTMALYESCLQQRLQNLRAQMAAVDLPALLITNPTNRRYLSGFTGTAGALFITATDAWLLTDFRYLVQAPQQVPHMQVIEHKPQMLDTVRELLAATAVRTVGFEAQSTTYASYLQTTALIPEFEWRPTLHLVEQLRMIKDEYEITVIRRATKIADDAFHHILKVLKPGMSEREVALELEWFMRRAGATSSSFEIIVASGERSALPHGIASDRCLQKGEFVKLDFGAYVDGYCSDLTRTVMLGSPSIRHRELYELVAQAQRHALLNIRPGMTGAEADALARDIITNAGYGAAFGHGTGHGFGMEIHEDPRLNSRSQTILRPGMTVTVEPGVYVPGFGGVRIEDDVLITEQGIEILTNSSKSFIIVD